MKRLTFVSIAALLLVASVALADLGTTADNKAACCQVTSSLAKDVLDGPDLSGDERFFMKPGLPPNIHFLFDNSGSMTDLPQGLGGGFGCGNASALEDYKDAHNWDSTKVYPPPDPGTGYGSDTVGKWDGMFSVTDSGDNQWVFRNGYWGDHLVTGYSTDSSRIWSTVGDACAKYFPPTCKWKSGKLKCVADPDYATCTSCLKDEGYMNTSSRGSNFIFTANFLRFDPPKFVGASAVMKKVVSGLKNARIGLTTFYYAANGSGNGETGGWLRQRQRPACDANPASGQTDDDIGNFVDTINGLSFDTNTPLAESLLNIGEYFSDQYSSWFGSTQWKSGGYINDGVGPWDSFIHTSFENDGSSTCYACQATSVVIVTDGEPTADSQVPLDEISDLSGRVHCPGDTGTSCSGFGNPYLDDVAKFVHTEDLRSDLDGDQTLTVYGIGFGYRNELLHNAARVGGGFYVAADDSQQLQAALTSIVNKIDDSATTYAAASVNTLQVDQTGGSILPRMKPSDQGRAAPWSGYLYRFGLTSEFLLDGGCDPVQAAASLDGGTPYGNDLNQNGQCDSVLLDKNNKPVRENGKGEFVLVDDPATKAVPYWEASKAFEEMAADAGTPAWQQRRIYTVVDSNLDGKIDWHDAPIAFDDSDAGVSKLLPYLGIGTDSSVCDDIALKRGQAAGALSPEDCAKVVIDWYRGADTLSNDPTRWDQDQLNPDGGSAVLKDIFHSSPVVVNPPTDRSFCSFSDQCTSTLFGTGTQLATTDGKDAYDQFVESEGHRDALVLVGSNGGMLHAFDDGQYDHTDPLTGIAYYTAGTGQEVWAFVPPDLLPKMLPYAGKHGFFVDNSPMVRDTWIDLNSDGKKQANEFRTVAVVGEGQGGVHHFALDLTDLIPTGGPGEFDGGVFTNVTTSSSTASKETGSARPFLWMWPQACDAESLTVGESFSNYVPRPPPIGAVALASSSDTGLKVNGQNAKEDWVVFFNGGYDQYMSRGRGMAMVELSSGKAIWSQFFDDGKTRSDEMRYPFAAGVSMMDIDQGNSPLTTDGLFDTANLPDYGGNLWTVRFYKPGILDGSGKVTNWYAARAFSAQPTGNDKKVVEPFTEMTSNAIQPSTGKLRTFFGSGDRYHLMDTSGPHCRLSNPYACAQQGCAVSTQVRISRGGTLASNTSATDFASFSGGNFADGGTVVGTDGANFCGSAELRLDWSHSGSGTCDLGAFANGNMDAVCSGADGGWKCTMAHNDWASTDQVDQAPSGTPANAAYYGLVTYGGTRTFDAAAAASSYDNGRLHPSDLTDVTDTVVNADGGISGDVAGEATDGWMLSYAEGDERTATSSALVNGCVLWNSFQPGGGGGTCSAGGTNTARLYQSSFVSGTPNCASAFNQGGGSSRFIARSVAAVPGEPTVQRTIIGGKGGANLLGPERGQIGGIQISEPNDSLRTMYQLELNRDQHACRHEGAQCE